MKNFEQSLVLRRWIWSRVAMRSAVGFVVGLALLGCGQKGPLKLPPMATRIAVNQSLDSQPTLLRGVASDLNTAQTDQSRSL